MTFRLFRYAVTNGTLVVLSEMNKTIARAQLGEAEVEMSVELAAIGAAAGAGAAGGGIRTLALAADELGAAAQVVVVVMVVALGGEATVEEEAAGAADRPATGCSAVTVDEATRWRLCFSGRGAGAGVGVGVGIGVGAVCCSGHAGGAEEVVGWAGTAPLNEPDSPGSCAMFAIEADAGAATELDAVLEGEQSTPTAPLEVFRGRI
jgi:multidrug efflux system outer membrane protein